MACENPEIVQRDVSLLLPEDDFLNFSETTNNLEKTLDAVCEVIQCRMNIYMQRKEKNQQILDSQMMKLDKERKEYIKKSETVMNDMGEAKTRLMQIEHSYFSMRNKLNLEKQTNKALEERIKQLQLDSKQKNVKFYKTSELFSTVVSWYKNYLNMTVSFDKENPGFVTITFKESKKDFKGYPYVVLEMLKGNKFQILLLQISNQPITILLRTSIIYTDSFLLISGVLTSYNLAKEISEKKKISWMRKAISRFIRLTPALLAVVLFYAYIWNKLGSGPIWNVVVGKNALLCRKYMWRNLIYVQNFFDFEDMCAPQTHQLALDMQLSLLAPLFVHLMHTYDKAGVGILQALFILSSIMRYLATSNNSLSVVIYHGMSVSQLYKTANLLYGQSFHRASPYILGTIVGYYLKKFEKGFEMPKAFAALGWILSFTFGFYSVVSPSPLALRSYTYDVQEAAQYAALSPVVWSLALSWVIVACHLGYGGFLNDFLCRKIFLVFSRISYSVYLTQFLVFFYKIGVLRVPELFSFAGSLDVTEFLVVIGVSVIVTLLFDIPMMEVKKIIFDSAKEIPEGQLQSEKVIQSEVFEGGEELQSEMTSREDSQESTEELTELIEGDGEEEMEADLEQDREGEVEDEGEEEEEDMEREVEGEGDYEDEEVEAGIEDEGELEDGSDEEAEGITHVLEIQPLRRSFRMHFSDDSEEKVFKGDPKTEDE